MADTTRTRSAEETRLLERARQRLPGGVLGTSRYADDVGFVVKHGKGSKIYDVSGREYIDYVMASGPLVLGHAHPAVVDAVRRQIEGGTTYFMVNEPIIELAEEICRAMPCAEQVRFTSTGSEATFFALRVARTARQRDKILKFEGGYHGAHDYSMMSATPRSPKAFPAPVPDSSGIPHALEAEVLIAPYNDLATVEGIVATHADELAAVIIEPFQRLIPPQPGFLQGLREITRRHGILLVFDEVVTGFRLAYGGAQEYYGVVPDIACVGKIVGAGFPLAAVCASEALVGPFDPGPIHFRASHPVSQAVAVLGGSPYSYFRYESHLAALNGLAVYEEIAQEFARAFVRRHEAVEAYRAVDGVIVGIALYFVKYSTWKGKGLYLDDLIVSEKFRGKGIGKKLLDAFMQEAQAMGAKQVHWQVQDWKYAGHRFLQKDRKARRQSQETRKSGGRPCAAIKSS